MPGQSGIIQFLRRISIWRQLLGPVPLGGWVLCFSLFAPTAQAGVLDLTWDVPTSNVDGTALTDLSHYRVYVGTSGLPCPGLAFQDVSSLTPAPPPDAVVTARLTTLLTGTTYVVQVTAVDFSGNESACSEPVTGLAQPDPPSSAPAGDGGGCFIATAAYGSALEPQVVLLQAFRDQYLVTNPPGQAFVQWYYRTSPPLAARIRQSPPLRRLVQAALWPLVGLAWLTIHPAMGSSVLLGAGGITGWIWYRRKKSHQTHS